MSILNFPLVRGDTTKIAYTLTLGDSETLTGASIWFTAKKALSDDDAAAAFQKTVGAGITVTNPTLGSIEVGIAAADTEKLEDVAWLFYDIQVLTAAGNVKTPVHGRLRLIPDVTRARGA